MGHVYLDANVLIPSITRGLIMIGAQLEDYQVVWSELSEEEAERHQLVGAAPISELRRRHGWAAPVATVVTGPTQDTQPGDAPHLLTAATVGAKLIVTENVKDFGDKDLKKYDLSVVHPDVFLIAKLSNPSYLTILELLAESRRREPNTAEQIHTVEVFDKLPRLAEYHASSFSTSLAETHRSKPDRLFRGVRCVKCERELAGPDQPGFKYGLDADCWAQTHLDQ